MTRNALAGFLVAAAAVLLAVLPIQPVAAMDASMLAAGEPSFILLVSTEQAMIDLTNADRAANGVEPVEFDPVALPVARQRAETQLGSQALNHYGNDGQLVFAELLSQNSLSYGLAGENLARASSSDTNITVRIEQALM